MDDPVARKGMGNPYLLAPTDKQPKVRVPRPKALGYSADMKYVAIISSECPLTVLQEISCTLPNGVCEC